MFLQPEDIPVLSYVLDALKDPSNPYPECAIFCLAQCARHASGIPTLLAATNRVAKEHLVTFDQLCMFIHFYLSLKEQKPPGSGIIAKGKLCTNFFG
jgi:hypothetical protein